MRSVRQYFSEIELALLPLICHVERIRQSASDRDIFIVRQRKNKMRFLDTIPLRSISFGMTRGLIIAILIFFALVFRNTFAQETPTTSLSPPPPRTVRISFVPPPIEGTISLGIYDPPGKLVRILHRESGTDDFTIGHDALITEWDGKNEVGEDMPVGKYNARGFLVGPLAIEGVDYFFNDWVVDEKSPHIKRINNLALNEKNLHLQAELASGESADILYDLVHGAMSRTEKSSAPIENVRGKDGTHWVIANFEIEQLSPTHEVLRRLAYQASDPQPKAIAASDREDKIFVLEENQNGQRVRGLTLIETKVDTQKQQPVSDWKVDFEKTIVGHKDFSLENGIPVANGGKSTPDRLTLRLRPNPLKRDKPGSVEVAVGFDSDGSYLKTSDGLPLRTISDTPNLSRALLTAHAENSIDVFQDDGAVVEQFRVSGADQMMAFDCGDFELK